MLAALTCAVIGMQAETNKDSIKAVKPVFTVVKANKITSIKDQNKSGTCWAYSTISFFESEILRKTGKTYDLSEMFVAGKTYMDRAIKAVRMHGDVSFSEGGRGYDVQYCWEHYGMVPESAMPLPGKMIGDSLANFSEFFSIMTPYVEAVAKNKSSKLTPAWKKDYISFTSYTHHPFWTEFAVEVQDNWRWPMSWNVPIDDLCKIIDHAILNGYTVMWGGDVTEDGFTRKGLGVAYDVKKARSMAGTDADRWFKLSSSEKKSKLDALGINAPEVVPTQEMRQEAFDNWETTDDHGMHIYGIAKDQNGKEYYMVKNSWGTYGDYQGTWYMTKAFVAYKTMDFIVNKNAVPKDIRKKIGI